MKTASAPLIALLATRNFIYADCFTITMTTGDIFRYTTAQVDVTTAPLSGGADVTWTAGTVLIEGLRSRASVGLTVDSQDAKITAEATQLVLGIPFITALRLGLFAGATIHRDRYYAAAWGSAWVGGMPKFHGRIGAVSDIGRLSASIKVKSDLILLDQPMPKNLQQPDCMNTLYDTGCGLLRASFVVAGAVGAAPSSIVIPWAGALAKFGQGTITFTSGANNKMRRTIKQATGSALVLAFPLPVTPTAGDTFNAWPGCNRVYADASNGCAFYANQAKFRGLPFVPQAESAV